MTDWEITSAPIYSAQASNPVCSLCSRMHAPERHVVAPNTPPKQKAALHSKAAFGDTNKKPRRQGGPAGLVERALGRGRSLRGITPGEGEIGDRRCICRDLYDHLAHG